MTFSFKATTRVLTIALLWGTSPVHALIINDDDFIANGGDLSNIRGTIANAMDSYRRASYMPPFLAVGRLVLPGGLCTGTWLGNSHDGNHTYILTAAHCVGRDYNEGKPLVGNFKALFIDWNKRLIGQNGVVYVPVIRNEDGYGHASTDIAILKMNRKGDILDAEGQAIVKPLINTRTNEAGKQVWMAGYGAWGTGTSGENIRYQPTYHLVERRALASSKIHMHYLERDRAMSAGFIPNLTSPYQARTSSGDGGSAWWLRNDSGQWVIAGVTSGSTSYASIATRTKMYADWLQHHYQELATDSKPMTDHKSCDDACRCHAPRCNTIVGSMSDV